MSGKQAIVFRGQLLTASRVALQTWLALLVEVGEELEAASQPWFADVLHAWRIQASIRGDAGMRLDDAWSAERVSVVTALHQSTRLQLDEEATWRKLADPTWSVLPGHLVGDGSHDVEGLVARVRQVADALIDLLTGTLRDPPDGYWLVGRSVDGPIALARRAPPEGL